MVVGGLFYLLSFRRGRRGSLLEALFNWAVVAAAAVLTLRFVTSMLSI